MMPMSVDELLQASGEIEEKIGYVFKDKKILCLAFIHSSFFNEHSDANGHNERLEFLGDAILDLIISEYVYNNYTEKAEGQLSVMRSRLVDASTCTNYMKHLGVAPYLLLGNGERRKVGKGRDSILADLFEAVLGAIYSDGGLQAAKDFFWLHFEEIVKNRLKQPSKNFKGQLQDYCQKYYQELPTYRTVNQYGPDHQKVFEVEVCFSNISQCIGVGSSKKMAEQDAAKNALDRCTGKRKRDEDDDVSDDKYLFDSNIQEKYKNMKRGGGEYDEDRENIFALLYPQETLQKASSQEMQSNGTQGVSDADGKLYDIIIEGSQDRVENGQDNMVEGLPKVDLQQGTEMRIEDHLSMENTHTAIHIQDDPTALDGDPIASGVVTIDPIQGKIVPQSEILENNYQTIFAQESNESKFESYELCRTAPELQIKNVF